MSDQATTDQAVQSPPPAAMPQRDVLNDDEPRLRLHQLASELMRTHNRRLLIEFLRLRRAMR